MSRAALLCFLAVTVPAAAQTPAPPAATPERWFAIAFDARGARHHLGPFVSLEACETERLDPRGARRALDRIYATQPDVEMPANPTEAQRDEWRRKRDTLRSDWLWQNASRIDPYLATIKFWEEKAICQRL
jgi:hypothetical protein